MHLTHKNYDCLHNFYLLLIIALTPTIQKTNTTKVKQNIDSSNILFLFFLFQQF